MYAQPGYAAIRIDFETKMRGTRRCIHGEQVFAISFERGSGQNFGPRGGAERIEAHASHVAGFKRAGLRVVAFEVRRIHHHTARNSGQA